MLTSFKTRSPRGSSSLWIVDIEHCADVRCAVNGEVKKEREYKWMRTTKRWYLIAVDAGRKYESRTNKTLDVSGTGRADPLESLRLKHTRSAPQVTDPP